MFEICSLDQYYWYSTLSEKKIKHICITELIRYNILWPEKFRYPLEYKLLNNKFNNTSNYAWTSQNITLLSFNFLFFKFHIFQGPGFSKFKFSRAQVF